MVNSGCITIANKLYHINWTFVYVKGPFLVDSYTSPYLKSAISSCMSDVPSLSNGKLDL
jgi:hypothetical protein